MLVKLMKSSLCLDKPQQWTMLVLLVAMFFCCCLPHCVLGQTENIPNNFRQVRVSLLATSASSSVATLNYFVSNCSLKCSASSVSRWNVSVGTVSPRGLRCTRQVLEQFSTWPATPSASSSYIQAMSLGASTGFSFLSLSSADAPYSPSLSIPAEVVYTGCVDLADASKQYPDPIRNVVLWKNAVVILASSFPAPFLVDAVVPTLNATSELCGDNANGCGASVNAEHIWNNIWTIVEQRNYCVEACFAAGGDGSIGGGGVNATASLRSSRDVVVLPRLQYLDNTTQVGCLCVPRRAPINGSGVITGAVGASLLISSPSSDIGTCLDNGGYVVLQANFYCAPTSILANVDGAAVCNSGCQARTEDACCYPGTFISVGVDAGGGSSDASGDGSSEEDQNTIDWLQWSILCVIVFGCVEGCLYWCCQRAYFRAYDEDRKSARRRRRGGVGAGPESQQDDADGDNAIDLALLQRAMSPLTEAESFALADAIIEQQGYVPPTVLLSPQLTDSMVGGSTSFGGQPVGDDATEMLFLYQEMRKHFSSDNSAAAVPPRQEESLSSGRHTPPQTFFREASDDVAATDADRVFSEIFGMSPVESNPRRFTPAAQLLGKKTSEGVEAGRDRCPICLEQFPLIFQKQLGTAPPIVKLECSHSVHRECLKQYLSHRVRRKSAMQCPVFGCSLVLE